jgi:hypothetical protein
MVAIMRSESVQERSQESIRGGINGGNEFSELMNEYGAPLEKGF